MRAVARILTAIALAGVTPFASAFAQQKLMLGHGAAPNVSVSLFAAVGDIRVVGWDKDSVELSGVVPKGVKADLHGGAPVERSKGLKMFIEAPEQSGREGKIVLRLPYGARLWLKTGSADLDVTGVTGGLDLNVVGGSITVHGNPKEVRAESMDGSVTIDGSPEWLRAKTATGDITMHGGADVGASTISGTIRTSGGEVERAKLESTTGTISFASGSRAARRWSWRRTADRSTSSCSRERTSSSMLRRSPVRSTINGRAHARWRDVRVAG